ncbi:ATP-binding protein [Mycolicibacter longobardus]|uniref:DNA topoisomerase (ATP-hydrolyzing) n=1 Tax=Mycolicibacter longobardus TaxID=1108812 RepID=A0A1X1YNV8_9MYCO|nr:ATP-binding protein [Mycolicibacter longobardus]MCV7384240.1 hypothetical protein [Mycolicibacter longobardus]ORW12742.1 hypothetical protein AWC16_06135 [Mycolicibacter longobardus]
MGGAHHCAVAEPKEDLDESPLRIENHHPQQLEFPEWIRSNADRFVYTDERGLHYLLWRLIDNAVGEAAAGHATAVTVRLLDDGGVEVSDNGRGISAGEPDPFLPTTYRVAAAWTPDWDDTSDRCFGTFGGTRSAGIWIVNALSTRLEVESTHADRHWISRYERSGSGAFEIGDTASATGTTVRFWADRAVFGAADYDFNTVTRRLHQLAFLNSGLTIGIVDERRPEPPRSYTFCFTDGLTGMVKKLNRTRVPIHEDVIHFCGRGAAGDVEVAMQWTGGYSARVSTFADNADTSDYLSSHENGFRTALTDVISRYARDRKLMRDTEPDLSPDDICEGLTAVVVVRHAEPGSLVNHEVKTAVQDLCKHHLTRWLESNPIDADAITEKAIRAADCRRTPVRTGCGRMLG